MGAAEVAGLVLEDLDWGARAVRRPPAKDGEHHEPSTRGARSPKPADLDRATRQYSLSGKFSTIRLLATAVIGVARVPFWPIKRCVAALRPRASKFSEIRFASFPYRTLTLLKPNDCRYLRLADCVRLLRRRHDLATRGRSSPAIPSVLQGGRFTSEFPRIASRRSPPSPRAGGWEERVQVGHAAHIRRGTKGPRTPRQTRRMWRRAQPPWRADEPDQRASKDKGTRPEEGPRTGRTGESSATLALPAIPHPSAERAR
jgi:hypothetical protein